MKSVPSLPTFAAEDIVISSIVRKEMGLLTDWGMLRHGCPEGFSMKKETKREAV